MALKPTDVPRWEPEPSDITEPSEGQKDSGWQPNEAPAAQVFNWFWNLTSKWISYLDDLTATALTWTAKQTFSGGVEVTSGVTIDELDVSGDLQADNITALGTISTDSLHVGGSPGYPARKWAAITVGGVGTKNSSAGSEAMTSVALSGTDGVLVSFATPLPTTDIAVFSTIHGGPTHRWIVDGYTVDGVTIKLYDSAGVALDASTTSATLSLMILY